MPVDEDADGKFRESTCVRDDGVSTGEPSLEAPSVGQEHHRTGGPDQPVSEPERPPPPWTPEEPLAAGAGPSIEGSPLGLIATQVAELVRARGAVREDELARAFARHYEVDVPASWQRTLKRFAWTGKALGYLEFDRDVWRPGLVMPHPDPRYGDGPFARSSNARTSCWPTTVTLSRRCSPRSTAAHVRRGCR